MTEIVSVVAVVVVLAVAWALGATFAWRDEKKGRAADVAHERQARQFAERQFLHLQVDVERARRRGWTPIESPTLIGVRPWPPAARSDVRAQIDREELDARGHELTRAIEGLMRAGIQQMTQSLFAPRSPR